MSLQRDLRDAAKAALRLEFPEWRSSAVTGARGYEYDAASLPAAQVSTPSVTVDHETKDGVVLISTDLEVSLFTSETASADIEDDLEAFSDRAIAALNTSSVFMGFADEIVSERYRFTRGEQGEKAPARMDITLSLFTVLET